MHHDALARLSSLGHRSFSCVVFTQDQLKGAKVDTKELGEDGDEIVRRQCANFQGTASKEAGSAVCEDKDAHMHAEMVQKQPQPSSSFKPFLKHTVIAGFGGDCWSDKQRSAVARLLLAKGDSIFLDVLNARLQVQLPSHHPHVPLALSPHAMIIVH